MPWRTNRSPSPLQGVFFPEDDSSVHNGRLVAFSSSRSALRHYVNGEVAAAGPPIHAWAWPRCAGLFQRRYLQAPLRRRNWGKAQDDL